MTSTTVYLVQHLSTLVSTHSLGAFVHALRTTDPALLFASAHRDDDDDDGEPVPNGDDVFHTTDDVDDQTLLGKAVEAVMTATTAGEGEGAGEDGALTAEQRRHVDLTLDAALNVLALVLQHSDVTSVSPDDVNEMIACIEDDQTREQVCTWVDTARLGEGHFALRESCQLKLASRNFGLTLCVLQPRRGGNASKRRTKRGWPSKTTCRTMKRTRCLKRMKSSTRCIIKSSSSIKSPWGLHQREPTSVAREGPTC